MHFWHSDYIQWKLQYPVIIHYPINILFSKEEDLSLTNAFLTDNLLTCNHLNFNNQK